MQKKTVSIPVLLIVVVCTIIVTATIVHFVEENQILHTDSVVKVTRSDLDDVQDLYDLITTNYVEKVDKKALIRGALTGMTEALGDRRSKFLSKEEMEKLREDVSSSFEGIGANLQLRNRLPYVEKEPIKNSPADKAGLKMGDVLREVNDTSTAQRSLDEIAQMIRGKKGTEVKLLIDREDEQFTVTIQRDVIANDTVTGTIDPSQPNVGSIQVSHFRETTGLEFRNIIEKLREQGAISFIVDLRQNSGGLFSEAERVASYFLKDGDTIVQFENDKKTIEKHVSAKKVDEGFKIKEPSVFLVDPETASSAELVAAAVKSKDIPVVGITTFGKASVQNVKKIGKSGYIQLTVLRWLTPEGESISRKGVSPTIEANVPEYAKLPPIPANADWRIGDSNEEISNLNRMLQALGHQTEGETYSQQTSNALKVIQTENNLEPTGLVDATTVQRIQEELFKLVKADDTAYKQALEALK
ncbi:peptidase S41 [Enterococcus florum]|uniref:Peptidase S41 n=1 Tax=Enterococcus florum TaxID=2480627 RepID=A0A4P5P555_9ENTE|nr:S41 family peptidase [Enterococcus florum]GCF92810.1 peptidase S41 [Enterococcus florum]